MDYAKILTQAGKILWKHKIIPVFFVSLFSIPTIVSMIIVGVFVFSTDLSQPERLFRFMRDFENPFGFLSWGAAILAFSGFSYLCLALGLIGTCKGVSLAESGADEINFTTLWQACVGHFWPVAAVFLAIGMAGVSLMAVFILPIGLIGFLFAPLICVFVPVFLLGRMMIEMLIVAIVSDDLELRDALERIWQMAKAYLWPLVLMTLVLMAIEFALNMLISMPLSIVQQVVMQFTVFSSDNAQDPSQMFGEMSKIMFGMMLLIAPITLAAQGLTSTYHLSATTLTYLSLKSKIASTEMQPETVENPVIR